MNRNKNNQMAKMAMAMVQLRKQQLARKQPKAKQQQQQLQLVRTPVPAAVALRVKPGRPKISHCPRGTRVTHSEIFANVLGSISYESLTWDLNPGQTSLPWLRNIAGNYTKYKIHSWSARYVPVDTNTSKPGRVYMGFDYDSGHAQLSNKADVTNLEDNASGVGYRDLSLKMNPSLAQAGVQWKRVRFGPVAGPPNLYDPASFLFGTDGFDHNIELGEVWMSYDIEFIGSQTSDALPMPRGLCVLRKTIGTNGFPDGIIGQAVFSTAFSSAQTFIYNDLGISLSTGGQLTLLPGAYKVKTTVTFTAGTSSYRDARLFHEFQGNPGLPYATTRETFAVGDTLYLTLTTYVSVDRNGAVMEPKVFVDGGGGATTEILSNTSEVVITVL
jgi:hypothetical protein